MLVHQPLENTEPNLKKHLYLCRYPKRPKRSANARAYRVTLDR